ncbi:hypothetical protein KK083_21730 [Fulvivirgaceae bacterium PWU4]|uniref:histidine kinase n=1 Tax=Chryseosolibacter histidini TaxID=2782349 RepID=A0AAP2GKX9_9BACT|nr:ATP-binding protein [Chryseosolibacter histidini]MBT1699534.1 hypothetical protein [Chryseosolibacter histidini]
MDEEITRRLTQILLQLDKALATANAKNEIYHRVTHVFEKNPDDLHFFLMYELDAHAATRVAISDADLFGAIAPEKLSLHDEHTAWPLQAAAHCNDYLIFDTENLFIKKISLESWQQLPAKMLLFPLKQLSTLQASAVVIFGTTLSGSLLETQIGFMRLIAAKIACCLQNVESLTETRQLASERHAAAEAQLEHLRYISSHDLQEPLRKIRTFTNLLLRSAHANGLPAEHLKKIDHAAAHMSGLLQNIVSYASISRSGNFTEWVDLTSVVEDATAAFETEIRKKLAVITYSTLTKIKGDRKQLTDLFKNLLENSLRFCEIPPVISISHRLTSMKEGYMHNYVEVIYTDNSIGFEQRHAGRAFMMFQKLHNKKMLGNGMGLAFCKKIVENHQGFIDVESKINQGTMFRIMLPVENDPEEE